MENYCAPVALKVFSGQGSTVCYARIVTQFLVTVAMLVAPCELLATVGPPRFWPPTMVRTRHGGITFTQRFRAALLCYKDATLVDINTIYHNLYASSLTKPVMEQVLGRIPIVLPIRRYISTPSTSVLTGSQTSIVFSVHVHGEPTEMTVNDLTVWSRQLDKTYGLKVGTVYYTPGMLLLIRCPLDLWPHLLGIPGVNTICEVSQKLLPQPPALGDLTNKT